ncbi:MAG: alpha/beta fold hydrolase [Nanoarchaeota archaeon]
MQKNKIFILGILVLLLSINLAFADTLQFVPKVSQSIPYNVEKDGNQEIIFTITNHHLSILSCIVNSDSREISSSQSTQISSSQTQSLRFVYNAPSKIKSFMGKPIPIKFTVTCTGNTARSCGFLYLSTCYDGPLTSYTYPASPDTTAQINLVLSLRDQQNLALLENYKQTISTKITNADSKLKTLKDLMDKTPSLLLPSNSNDFYNGNKKNLDLINSKFDKLKYYLEEEIYDFPQDYSNPSVDSSTLSDIESSVSAQITQITSNIDRYKQLENLFNNEILKSNDLMKPYLTKSNSDILENYNSITNLLESKFEKYQFTSLDEAKSSIDNYLVNYQNFISELDKREKERLETGLSIFKKEFDSRSSMTGNFVGDDSSSLMQLCDNYGNVKNEIDKNNEKIYSDVKNNLKELSYNVNSMSYEEQINEFQLLNSNFTSKMSDYDREVKSSVKNVNLFGKKLDLRDYSSLVQQYNSASLSERQELIYKIDNETLRLKQKGEELTSNQTGFLMFFKKIYYSVFGEKQKIDESMSLETDNIINLSGDFVNFYADNCDGVVEIKTSTAKSNDINTTDQKSDIDTTITTSRETCKDENGDTTFNCCNDDSYKNREDLYPIIFVHGHAFESDNNPIQEELRTFDEMSNYFKQNGYIDGGFLYPESAAQLSKGLWAYCKPVVFKVTYYEGITNGAPAQYNYKSSIAEYSPVLKKEVDQILTATNKDRAIIVAHSMGGIISRYYLRNDVGKNKIDKLITIATPNYGTVDAVDFGANYLGGKNESKEMGRGSDFLEKLNYPHDSLVDSYTLVGNISKVPIKLGTYCTNCDGVVYATTAQLKEAKGNFVFNGSNYSHTSIYNRQDVAQKVLDIIKNT